MPQHHLKAAIVALVGLGIAAPAAQAQGSWPLIGSSAYGVSAHFVSGWDATGLRPAPFASSHIGWQGHHNSALGTLNETLGIVSAGTQIATLQVTAGNIDLHAAPGGQRLDSTEASASGSIGSLQITLQAYPAPAGTTPTPLLSITASDIDWSASDDKTGPKAPVTAGSTSFGSLSISGSLLAGDTVNTHGTIAADDVAVIVGIGAGQIRITLNRQIIGGVSTCTSSCTFTPHGITTSALAVHFDQVPINSEAVTGEITVGDANAHIRPAPSHSN